ncbi:hypothetical protein L1887_18160 [Cichorium endivia]|nr:hypothetical protein L1887_18160 [Cichorium endivia]
MLGFIDGTLKSPQDSSLSGKEKVGHHHTRRLLWRRSNALVKGWIIGSLSEKTLGSIVNFLKDNVDFSAKDIWDELQIVYGSDIPRWQSIHSPEHIVLPQPESPTAEDLLLERQNAHNLELLGLAVEKRYWFKVLYYLRRYSGITSMDKITKNGDTTLHIAMEAHYFMLLLLLATQKLQSS